MRTYDLSPFWRSSVGFDRLFDLVNDTVNDSDNYPLYDIERTGEDQYRISMALAGFSPEEITITAEQSTLTVEGRKANKGDHDYLHQGISTRPFRRVFNLADYVQVKDATFENGMQDCTGSGTAGGDEAASHRDRSRRQRQPANRTEAGGLTEFRSGLSNCLCAAWPRAGEFCPVNMKNRGGLLWHYAISCRGTMALAI
jgi:molecular chaperone IbpA